MTDWLRTAWNAQSRKHSQSRKQRYRPKRRRGLQRHVESLEARRLLAADVVSLEETQTLAEHAKSIWESTGLSSEQIQELESLQYQVADLGENKLAQYRVGVITIDDNAAGNLWFVDQTPLVNEEFHEVDGVFTADTATLAMGKIDLLTALLHEQGHALGLDGRVESSDVMNDGLQSGVRRLPFMDQAAEADPGSIQTVEYLTSVSTGGNQSIDNRMPYGTVNYVVALTGLFPSRNLTDSEPMIGSVEMFAGNFAPRGYALAHGQLLPIAQNTALFSILGTTYGGDGQTTFGLPDLQGRVPIGAGQGPGLANYSLGQKGGVETNTLAANQLINHTHTVGGGGAITSAGDATSVTIDNRQPYLALTPAIALVGVFPSRNLGSDPGIGSVGWFAGNFAPRGWAKAEGQLLDIASYNALFSILGTTYGGDGRTTFGLPDLRGRAAVHYGTGPGLPNISLGQKAGSEQSVLTVSHLPTHSHGIPDAPISTDNSGGGQSFDNHQPILGLNYNIALQGTFPSRNLDSGEDDTQFDDEDTIGVGFVSGTLVLDETDALPMIEAIVQEGIDRWASVGISDEQIAQLQATEIRLRDLASGRLASADVDVITIDRDASNRGWFLDATPGDDFEFGEIDPRTGELVGTAEGTQGHYDLLTAIMHEQGHILGLEHTEMPGELMYGGLLTGGRRLPDASYLVIADQDEHDGDTASYLAGGEPALASIGIFAGNFNPRGWAQTDGQILPINQNQALFSLLGTTYGGDGGTTFGLPELRGRAVVGEGQLQVIGGTNYQLGQRGGTPSTTLTPTQMPVHDHDIPTGNPIANNDNGPDLMENGGAGSVNILANDTDPNGNPSAPINGATAFSVDLDQTTDGIQTSLTNDQGEWTLDTGTGVVTFTPAADFDGRASIVYTLTDYTGQSDKANITFAVRAASGDVVVNLPSGGGSVNVVLEGTEIVVRRGVMELSRTPVSTTTRLTINGTDASDDTLRIDLSGGNPIPEGGLHFNGGVGGDDALVVVNGGEIDTDYQTSGEQSGEIDIDGRIVTFENLEPLDFTGIVAGNVMITVDAFLVTGSEVITTISANGANTLISFDTTGGLESIEFGVINGTLTINLDKTDIDVVNVEGLGSSFAGNLVINGDVLDTVNFTGAIDLGGRDLMVSGKQIDVFASLQSSGGNVSFVANDVNLQNSVDVGGGTVGMTPMTPGAVVDLGTQVSGGVNKVYWVDASSDLVGRADANALNSNVETIVSVTGSTPNLNVPTGIGLDPATGKVYFSDTGNDFIARADFAALNSNVQTLLDPIGFSNDVTIAGGKLYWIDTNAGFDHIVRSDLDGSNPEVLVDGLDSPQGIAVDVAGGKVYWSDSNDDHIQRADINGDLASNNISKEDVVTGVIFPEGISLDLVNRKIYFVDDSTADRIVRADMDGVNSNVEEVVTGLTSPNGIAVDPIGGKVYWSDAGSGFDHIARADIDLSGGPNNNVEEIVTGLGTPNKIDLLYDTGNFTLTNAELNRITANTLIIGNAASGNVTITSEINPVNITTLQIASGGMIGDINTTTTDIDAAHVILSGNVAPGNSPGILSVVGNFSLADDDTFTVEIGGTTAGNGAGFHDQIDVAGTVAIGGNVTLSLAGVGGFAATAGDAFTIIKNDGTADAVTGTFAGLAEGATILNILGSGMDATISYVAGDGNDVVITIVNPVADYGDAPTAVQAGGGTFVSDYPVTLADNGARHDDVGPTLGASRDVEPDGIPDPGAFGDDNDNSDDEDGIQLPANLFAFTTNSSTPSLTVDLQSPDPVSNILNGWIDFNRDGDWDDVGEQIFTDFDLGTSAGIQSISFSVPQDSGANFEDGNSYARFRLNTTGGLSPTGAAADGEVEDYAINLVSLVGDFGDAPTAAQAGGGTFVNDYPTTLADDGARHAFSNGPFLGNSIDYEKDGIPTTSADGDDSNGIDDENGIAIGVQLSSSISGTMTEIGVTSSGPGLLDGWIDWNRDGDWDDNGERILINQPVATGTNTLTYLVPQDTGTNVLSGTTFARFRISTAGVAGVTGAAPDGEVEDYQVTVLNVNGSVDTAGNLIIQDNDGSRNDDITIEIDGPNYRITDPVNGFVAGSGAAQDGPNSMLVPIANVTGEIRVIGGGGDDSLTINNNGGRIQRPIVYDGGGQGAMGDSLTVVNDANPATLQVLSYTNANDGNVVLDGVAITYTGLEPIIAGNAADTILNLPDVTVNTATLQNSAVAGEIEIVGATFEDTVIPNPTNSLTVNLGDAGDSLTIDALDGAFAATLEVNGGVLNDVVDASNLTTSLTINGGAGNDQLTGSTANDVINGGDDIDTIHGNSGNDTITGGLGADMQFGDAGDDTFVWNNGDGPDDNTGGADTDTFTFNGADGADDVLSLLAGVGDGSLGGAAFHLARTAPSAFTIEGVEIEDVNINGLAGADDITVVPFATLNVAVDGGDPAAFPGDVLTVDVAGTTGANLDVSGPQAGEFSFTSAHNNIVYSDIEAIASVNGSFATNAINTGAGDDDIVLRLDGLDTVVTVGGAEFFRTPTANLAELTINGEAGDDTFTVDYVNGNPIPAGGLFFNGNGQGVGGDTVLLQNGNVTTVHHTFANDHDGSVDIDGSMLTYTGLEPIVDNLGAVDRIFTFTGGSETITLGDDLGAVVNVSRIDSTLGESVDFINPTNSLTVNTGSGTDLLNVTTLDAAYAASLILHGGDGATDVVTMTNLDLINTPGRGLWIQEFETIDMAGGTLSGNTAVIGGGLLIDNSTSATTTATLSGVTISGNTATGGTAPLEGGGGIYNNGAILNIIAGSTISGNFAITGQGSGGGILSTGTLTISDSSLVDNDANRAGGGIEIAAGSGLTTLTDVTLDRNDALAGPGNGGGLHVSGAGNVAVVRGFVRDNTAAAEGGGLWNGGGTLTINGTTISGNVASGAAADQGGGGVFNDSGVLDIDNAIIQDNEADGVLGSGGGVFTLDGTVRIDNSTIQSNSANRAGGGIEIVAGTVTLSNVQLLSNDVDGMGTTATTPNPGNGGALHVTATATVTLAGGLVQGNLAREEGGGLWNSITGTMIIDNVSLDSNVARAAAGGLDQGGGGVFNNGGEVTIRNNTSITNNLATDNLGNGGGVMTVGGTVTIQNSALTGNQAARAGGGIENNAGDVSLTGVNVGGVNVADGNTAGINGGGLHASDAASVTTVTGGLFQNNLAQQEGGGLWNGDGLLRINNTTITQNTANSANNVGNDQGGGGVFNIGGTLDINSVLITANEALANNGNGGAVMTVGGTVTIDDSSLQSNAAGRAGGGIENNDGQVTVTNETVGGPAAAVGNTAAVNGGGLHAGGNNSVTIVNGGLFQNNVAGEEGGGLWNGSGLMTINGTQILDNTANSGNNVGNDQGGGGVFNIDGTLDIDNATISGNVATLNSGNGGGVMTVGGTVTIDDTLLQSNEAARAGGGIENNNGNVTVTASEVGGANVAEGNTAGINGGGLHASGGASVTIVDGGTFQNNVAQQEGGGLWNGPGTMTIRNHTLISDNTA
ncbi:tail fiber protein, partial [Rhodopirellula sp. SWK7]|uniref:tail fiber protein n=1 Tax=Rhodopirellula sp. SWK7 TaxID=595460 RepID=UPI0005C781CD